MRLRTCCVVHTCAAAACSEWHCVCFCGVFFLTVVVVVVVCSMYFISSESQVMEFTARLCVCMCVV